MSAKHEDHATSTAPIALPTTLERPVFVPAFRGHLTPGDEPCDADFLAQAAPYGGLFLRMRSDCVEPVTLAALLEHREPQVAGALYCAIPETMYRGAYAHVLKARGYAFWNHEDSSGELIYYRWCNTACASRVPQYATSIEGGGLIVLSPCETGTLCVYELGRWCFPGGAVQYGETTLETALRKSREECGVELDDAFQLQLAGGWNFAASRDRRINDHFLIYVGRALSEAIQLDDRDITQAKWVPLATLQPLMVRIARQRFYFSPFSRMSPSLCLDCVFCRRSCRTTTHHTRLYTRARLIQHSFFLRFGGT
jgi:8-oxo-dGTP pyrophosphatase MutT (NUDIX family)